MSPSSIPVVLDTLSASDFYRDSHADIFHAIVGLWNGDADSVDTLTVASAVPKQKSYIYSLVESCPVVSNAAHYAQLVKNCSTCRSLVRVGQEIIELGYKNGDETPVLLERAEDMVHLLRPQSDGDTHRAKEIAHLIIQETADHVAPRIVSTGFGQLDAVCGGFHASNFIVVGARPGVGKTACALNVAHRVSQQGTVLFFSMEMSRVELMERVLCSIACVPVTHLRRREMDGEELARIISALPEIEGGDLRIVDNPSLTMLQLKSKARQFASKTNLALIIIDYLQLLTMGRKTESRFVEVSTISRELKALARDLAVPIMALSQLNRTSAFEGTKPQIDQLRESGSLEQDADQVWLLSWPKNTEFDFTDTLIIDVAKNRHGAFGEVSFPWDKNWQRIEG